MYPILPVLVSIGWSWSFLTVTILTTLIPKKFGPCVKQNATISESESEIP